MSSSWFNSLSREELEVEYLVRGIAQQRPDSRHKLIVCLQNEKNKTVPKPLDCHIVIEPEVEAESIQIKVEEFAKFWSKLNVNTSYDEIEATYWKAVHWYDRIHRFKHTHGKTIDLTNLATRLKRGISTLTNELQARNSEGNTHLNQPPPPVNKTASSPIDGDRSINTKTPNMTTLETNRPNANLQSPEGVSNEITNPCPNQFIDEQDRSQSELDLTQARRSSNPFNSDFSREIVQPPSPRALAQRGHDQNISSSGFDRLVSRRYYPKWKLQFKGTSPGLDVNDFIFQLEFMARMDGLPSDNLVNYIHLFVSDVAEQWFWVFTRHNPQASWNQLRSAFLLRFSSEESERETRRLIQRRVQKESESFNQFCLEIETLNGRLVNRFDDYELLTILRDNMSSALRNATLVSTFNSVEHLRATCQKYELLWNQTSSESRSTANSFRSRPQKGVNYLGYSDEDLLDKSVSQFSKLSIDSDRYETDIKVPDNIEAFQFSGGCYNCKASDHRFFDCNIPISRRFCMGCGEDGVLKPQCPKCVKRRLERAGNQYSSETRPGEPRSGNPFVPRQPTQKISKSTQS